jgi:hypothetical protein
MALVAAPSANAATLYACVKKNGTARIFTKKPRCKKGEVRLSWNIEGPAGRNGLNGLNGTNGANGVNGKEGKEGPAGPLLEALPSGRSETGVYSLEGAGSVIESGWGFPLQLGSEPTAHLIKDGEASTAQCPGSVSKPTAAPGNLCVYEAKNHSAGSSEALFNPENESFGGKASRFGWGFAINNGSPGSNAWSMGTWAVTAP